VYSDRYAISIHPLCEANTEFRNVKLGAIVNVVLYRVKSFTAIANENGRHFFEDCNSYKRNLVKFLFCQL